MAMYNPYNQKQKQILEKILGLKEQEFQGRHPHLSFTAVRLQDLQLPLGDHIKG